MALQTPAQAFGIAPKTTADFFRASGIPQMIAPEQIGMLAPEYQRAILEGKQAELDRQRLQGQIDAENAANEFFGQMGDMTPEEASAALYSNPTLFRSSQLPAMQSFIQGKQSFGNQFLTNPIRNKLQDPTSYRRFDDYVNEGMEAADAYEAVLADQHNDQQAISMLEAGVDMDTVNQLRQQGTIDPVIVAGLSAKAKQRAALLAKMKPTSAMTISPAIMARYVDTYGEDAPAKIAELQAIIDSTNGASSASMQALLGGGPQAVPSPAQQGVSAQPSPAGAASAQTMQKAPPAAAPRIPTAQERRAAEVRAESQPIIDEIGKQWTEQKNGFEKMLEDKAGYVSPEQKLIIAADIARNEAISDFGNTGTDNPTVTKVAHKIIGDIGKSPFDTAFEELGNERWGSQRVYYEELAKNWAEDYLRRNGYGPDGNPLPAIDKAVQDQKLTPEEADKKWENIKKAKGGQ